MPGLAQNNYNDRVMVRGKQTVRHVIGQYDAKMLKLILQKMLKLICIL